MLKISFLSACKYGWTQVVKTLLDTPNGKDFILMKDSNGEGGFMTACNFERGDVVNLLLDHSNSKHSIPLDEEKFGFHFKK